MFEDDGGWAYASVGTMRIPGGSALPLASAASVRWTGVKLPEAGRAPLSFGFSAGG